MADEPMAHGHARWPIGSGKTSLCKEVSNMGFRVLDENFLDMPAHSLHPQSLFMETKWVCAWYVDLAARS